MVLLCVRLSARRERERVYFVVENQLITRTHTEWQRLVVIRGGLGHVGV